MLYLCVTASLPGRPLVICSSLSRLMHTNTSRDEISWVVHSLDLVERNDRRAHPSHENTAMAEGEPGPGSGSAAGEPCDRLNRERLVSDGGHQTANMRAKNLFQNLRRKSSPRPPSAGLYEQSRGACSRRVRTCGPKLAGAPGENNKCKTQQTALIHLASPGAGIQVTREGKRERRGSER